MKIDKEIEEIESVIARTSKKILQLENRLAQRESRKRLRDRKLYGGEILKLREEYPDHPIVLMLDRIMDKNNGEGSDQ
ncbi:hypothetical protein [Pelagicoccus albus]|uniref:Uncharacterized protein n=1 Tax=Pelagicoccus albus TaxID=415222 RepID=A0A7X1B762_9BACT|nr:hypothetical protein [Pelagicoccus albus]MBC2605623.1 hypothetical protein [Pelagicoccus albus]